MLKATCFYKTICCIFLFIFMGFSVLADGAKVKTNQPNRMDSSFSGIERCVKISQEEIIGKINDSNKKIDKRIDEKFGSSNRKIDAYNKKIVWNSANIVALSVSIVAVLLLGCGFVYFVLVLRKYKTEKYKTENIKPFFDNFNTHIPVLNLCKAIKKDLDDEAKIVVELKASILGMKDEIKNKNFKMSEEDINKIKEKVNSRLSTIEDKITSIETKISSQTVLDEIVGLNEKIKSFGKQLLAQSQLNSLRENLKNEEVTFEREKIAFENDKEALQKEKAALNDLIRLAVEKEKENWNQSLKKERDENKDTVERLNDTIGNLLKEKNELIEKNGELERNSNNEIAEARQAEAEKCQESIGNLLRKNGTLEERLRNEQENAKKEKAVLIQKSTADLAKKDQEKASALLKQKELLESEYAKKYEGEILQLNSDLTNEKKHSSILVQERDGYKRKSEVLDGQLRAKNAELLQAESKVAVASKAKNEAESKVADMRNTLAQKQEEKMELEEKLSSCERNIKTLKEEGVAKDNLLSKANVKLAELQKAIYPSEFNTDEKFMPLKAHLETWLSEKIPAAETVKSSLGLFAQRAALGEDIWQQALRSISIGITQTLQAKGASASEVFDELMRWNTYLMSFSDEEFQFSLKVPAIGASVDLSWMSVKTKGATRVSRILAWAVYNQYGVAHNAEVE